MHVDNFSQGVLNKSIKPARIAFVCEGDAEGDAFSGSAKSMVDHLRALGHTIYPINVRPSKFLLLLIAAREFSLNRSRWRARYRFGHLAHQIRSTIARRALASLREEVDLVFQIGATFAPPSAGRIPYVVYCDWNMSLSIRNSANNLSATGGLSTDEADRVNRTQQSIYTGSARIFTISERLRESFIEDYQILPDRVVRAYAGANLDLSSIPLRPREDNNDCPTILFIGKEFERKGGDVLLRTFQSVRQKVPNARLLIIGPTNLDVHEAGVEVIGSLSKKIPAEYQRLIGAFCESSVFCLPSRLDPFPNVVREAMFYSLPCVTTDIWAMPEMVVDGETGFTVPVDDHVLLAERLVQILSDDTLARNMGIAGRKRADDMFTWAASAKIMHEHIQQIVKLFAQKK